MKNINTKKLIQYIDDLAEIKEIAAYKWSEDGHFDEAFKAKVAADFIKDELVKGIENDLIYPIASITLYN
jgi:hypothetical protein